MGVEKINLGNLKPEVPLRIFTTLMLSVYILMVQKKRVMKSKKKRPG